MLMLQGAASILISTAEVNCLKPKIAQSNVGYKSRPSGRFGDEAGTFFRNARLRAYTFVGGGTVLYLH